MVTDPLIRDISRGQEIVPISFRNDYDYKPLSDFKYTNQLKINPELYNGFQSSQGCSCTDVCVPPCPCVTSTGYNGPTYGENGIMTDEFRSLLLPATIIQECSPLCSCSKEKCRNRAAQRPLKVQLEVYMTRKKGFGLRTLQPIKENQFVMEYIGELERDVEEEEANYDYSFGVELDKNDYVVTTDNYSNASRFMNHSCNPNLFSAKVVWDAKRIPHICFYARRDIGTGEELTIDYGPPFWEVKISDFTCKCGSEECQYTESINLESE